MFFLVNAHVLIRIGLHSAFLSRGVVLADLPGEFLVIPILFST